VVNQAAIALARRAHAYHIRCAVGIEIFGLLKILFAAIPAAVFTSDACLLRLFESTQ